MAAAGDRYSFSLTTFSPSGKLVQIEYALNAVLQGYTSVGIRTKEGIVLATEKRTSSSLVDADSLSKISILGPGLGLVYSGMGPDARVLVAKARKSVQAYWQIYREWPSVLQVVKELATVMQEFTQSGGVRPFGVSLLVAGFDDGKPGLYQVDPSGSYWAWKASALGKNMMTAKTFLEKRYQEDVSLEDAIHTAILVLKDGFEGNMTSDCLEIGVLTHCPLAKASDSTLPEYQELATVPSFRVLSDSEISDYLANL